MSVVSPMSGDVLDELEHLPVQSAAALQVLCMIDDAGAGAAEVARAVSADPALTTRIMRTANSSYYGLSGRVSSVTFGITVLGFDTVRAMAAVAAVGLNDDSDAIPGGLLEEAAATAVAASLVAPHVGARPPEAYSIGLLHNLGAVLFARLDRRRYDRVLARVRATGRPRHEIEFETYGTDSALVAAHVLGRWHFPQDFVDSLAAQHTGVDAPRSPLGKALKAGMALAAVALDAAPGSPRQRAAIEAALQLGQVDASEQELIARVKDESQSLAKALTDA